MSRAADVLELLGRPSCIRLGGSGLGDAGARLGTGIQPIDRLLSGGLPRGRITELVGSRSAGRTALAVQLSAVATRRGEVVAWVDSADRLDPEALAAAGALLSRLLWVRPSSPVDALRTADLLLRTGGFGLVLLDLDVVPATRMPGAWSRLRQAAEQSRAVLLAWGGVRLAEAGAALELDLSTSRVRWDRGPGHRLLLDGIEGRLTVARSRLGRSGASTPVSWRTAA